LSEKSRLFEKNIEITNFVPMGEERLENVWDYPRPPALEKVTKRYISK
jgi:hypothetical protein